MFYNLFNCRLYLFLTLFLTLPISSNAHEADKGNSMKGILPSDIKLEQSKEQQHIIFNNGHLIALPAIVKKTIDKEWAIVPQSLAAINYPALFSIEQKKEISHLSEKLGIKIRDLEYLDLYREAAKWIGTRYRWAGKSPKGVDCSGLTSIIVKTVFNKELSRSSHIIANELSEELDTKNLRPGDLLFFSTRRYTRINHVGVYLGDRQFIHASRKGVVVSSLDEDYYNRTLRKAGRI